jgi:hypothetical protein
MGPVARLQLAVLSYATSAYLRALSAAEVQSSKSHNPVYTLTHDRNLPGRDVTRNSPGDKRRGGRNKTSP